MSANRADTDAWVPGSKLEFGHVCDPLELMFDLFGVCEKFADGVEELRHDFSHPVQAKNRSHFK